MVRGSSARRYSQAVFEIALEKNELERWQADFARIVEALGDASFHAFLESPKFRLENKVGQLSGRLKDMNPLALNLIYLLIARGKLDIINEIADDYQRLVDSYHGIERAEVATAVSLDDEEKRRVAEFLSAKIGRNVVLKAEIDPGLVGGIVARVQGKLLDGSTRSKLAALKKELAGAPR